MVKWYENGSYKLQDVSIKIHETRVNVCRLKPYLLQNLKQEPIPKIITIVKMMMREVSFPLNKIGNDVVYARGINTSSI